MGAPYTDQVRLLVSLLPHVAKQDCFAVKGGTAINLFLRDMPRLSVDIDLAYIPVENRDTSMAGIDEALSKITNDIKRAVPRTSVRSSMLKGTDKRYKLVVSQGSITVKVEVTPVLRGSVFPTEPHQLSPKTEAEFGFARVPLLSFEDLYAGKICAALDRQHPRDLYDIHLLLKNEGISERLKNAFLAYLMSHNRPMAELLAPHQKDIEPLYRTEFEGMTYEPISLQILEETLSHLVRNVHGALTDTDKHFLVSFKNGEADWSAFSIPEAERLPAIQWKMLNLNRMDRSKREKAVAKLEKILQG
ncbi:MAG: nucleotidyl transferase AbiEii/AbiGii toxin family protein [Desulfobacterales bacterium]|nr:nucleotidyl transferase AbiEii/AbiGii toxin family protein [Desulfobacterales bacterium]